MAVPDYESTMLPILKYLSDGEVRKTGEIVAHVAAHFKLDAQDMKELIPSGKAKLINNRVGWACTYLRKAGLIMSPQYSFNKITAAGSTALAQDPAKIDSAFLSTFGQFREFLDQSHEATITVDEPAIPTDHTPEEIMGMQSEIISKSLQNDLLEQISTMDPAAFEQLVVDLLLAMGYGGTAEEAGKAIGQSNDGGVDGSIMEDVLGLDTIYVQAKRWKNPVPIKEVRDFAGALLSKRSTKGVFITTSSFSAGANDFVSSIDRRIILVDGKRLGALMVKYNLGVTVKQTFEVKELDSDYFNR